MNVNNRLCIVRTTTEGETIAFCGVGKPDKFVSLSFLMQACSDGWKHRDGLCHKCYHQLQKTIANLHPPRCPPAPIGKTTIPMFLSIVCMYGSMVLMQLISFKIGIIFGLLAVVLALVSVIWMRRTVDNNRKEWVEKGGWPYECY